MAMLEIQAAQIQFQSGSYDDQDSDGVGNYGHLGQLTGQHATDRVPAGAIRLLALPIFCPGKPAMELSCFEPQVSAPWRGYRFASYVANGRDLPMPASGLDPWPEWWADAQNHSEWGFLIVAWPEKYGLTGRLSFAINGYGRVLAADIIGAAAPEDVLRVLFGAPEVAWRSNVHRPGVEIPPSAIDPFAGLGGRISLWIDRLRASTR